MPFLCELTKLTTYADSQPMKDRGFDIATVIVKCYSLVVDKASPCPLREAFPTQDDFRNSLDAKLKAAVDLMGSRTAQYASDSKDLSDKAASMVRGCPEPTSTTPDDLKIYIATMSAQERPLMAIIKQSEQIMTSVKADAAAIPADVDAINPSQLEPCLQKPV
jgi:hypothetical protein